jgi:dTDP-4-amino-4,6-dideoxygalactose transaminase
MIPFIDLKPYVEKVRLCAEHGTLCPDFGGAVNAILDRHEFIGKETVARLEGLLRTRSGASHVIACGSGSSALTLALAAHGIDSGLVAMPNVTFWATYEAIVHARATPLLIDINKGDLQMSFEEFERAHERHQFRAAILPHLFGWCSPRLGDFRAFCCDRNIVLIEDGAQAFGVEYDGRSVFADANTITLSFFPAKVIGGITDGGAVFTRHECVATTIRALANHGRVPGGGHYDHEMVGWNSRMSGIDAEWLCLAVDHADAVIDERRRLRSLYRNSMFDLAHRIGMTTHFEGQRVRENGYLEVWTLPKPSEAVVAELHNFGVHAARVYPKPVSEQPDAWRTIRHGDLFNSYDFCNRVLNLPLWYGMKDEHVATVVHALEKVLL